MNLQRKAEFGTMKALYGFKADLPPFRGRSPKEQVALLQSWGADSIFGGYANKHFVDAAHQQGLNVYAEFACFQGKEWWTKVPESRPLLADGTVLDPIEWYCGVNPSVPSVREELLERLATFIQTHEIDGVWLDFIRWPCRWENPEPKLLQSSYDQATIGRFAAERGLARGDEFTKTELLANRDYLHQWYQWRIDQISSWVAEARAVVKKTGRSITLGLFGIPWRQSDFDGAIHTVIGQDYKALAQSIDIFSPMTYHLMCGQTVPWIEHVTREIAAMTAKPVIPIIQSVNAPTVLQPAEYRQALKTAEMAAGGAIVFTMAGLLEDEKLAITKELWRQS